MERPLLLLACSFTAGAWLDLDLPSGWLARLLAVVALTLLLLMAGARGAARVALPGLLAASGALGISAASVERLAYERNALRSWVLAHDGADLAVRLRGRAAADLLPEGGRRSLLMDVVALETGGQALALPGRLRLEIGGTQPLPQWRQGDEVLAWATVRAPQGLAIPGVTSSAERERWRRVHAHGYCKSGLLLEAGAPGGGLVALLADLRRAARREIARYVPPGVEQGLVRAMLLGDRAALGEQAEESFRAAGTLHVLAISGAQVALLAGWLAAGAGRAGAGRLVVAALALAVLPAYALLVGGDVPVARAALTAVVAAWGLTLDLRADAANLLAAAALALVTERPGCAAEPGFQLSFAATLGLVALTGRLRPSQAWPLRLDLAWAASLAAQLAVAPVLAAQFQRLPLAGLLLNALAVPLSALLLGLGLACVAAAWLNAWLASRVGELAWVAAHALLRSAELAQALPWLDRDVGPPAAWVVALHMAALVALSRGSLRPRAAAGLGVACLFLVVGPGPQADGRLHLTLVDVGQGQCAVLRTPGGRALVVDAGGAFEGGADLGRVAVGPYLRSQGIGRIDLLALSHAHPDHAGGMPYLMRRFEVGEVWEGLAPRADPQYAAFDRAAQGLPRRAVSVGVAWERDGVRVRVLWPRPHGRPPLRVRNDDSLVLEAGFAGQRFLLTGDVERGGEAALEGSAVGVSVPHHGSRTSSSADWLARARPRVALVSAGRRNRFGHPHGEVLARYLALGSLVARTDRDGTVTLHSDGATLWLESTRGGWHATLR